MNESEVEVAKLNRAKVTESNEVTKEYIERLIAMIDLIKLEQEIYDMLVWGRGNERE